MRWNLKEAGSKPSVRLTETTYKGRSYQPVHVASAIDHYAAAVAFSPVVLQRRSHTALLYCILLRWLSPPRRWLSVLRSGGSKKTRFAPLLHFIYIPAIFLPKSTAAFCESSSGFQRFLNPSSITSKPASAIKSFITFTDSPLHP